MRPIIGALTAAAMTLFLATNGIGVARGGHDSATDSGEIAKFIAEVAEASGPTRSEGSVM
jgi:hypothetical protein